MRQAKVSYSTFPTLILYLGLSEEPQPSKRQRLNDKAPYYCSVSLTDSATKDGKSASTIEIKARLIALEKKKDAQKCNIDALDKEKDAHKRAIDALRKETKTHKNPIIALRKKKGSHECAIGAVEKEKSSLENALDAVEEEKSSLECELHGFSVVNKK